MTECGNLIQTFCASSAGNSAKVLRIDCVETPQGAMIAVADDTHLHMLEFFNRKNIGAQVKAVLRDSKAGLKAGRTPITDQINAELDRYFQGALTWFETPLAMGYGTDFQRMVWQELRQINYGKTASYQDIAHKTGRPSAVRAVARANASNRIAIVIPCHRVIGANGALTGYAGGLARKEHLLNLERARAA